MTLHLLRHGMTAANEAALYCGVTDVSLSPRGRAELLKKAAAGGYPRAAGLCVYTSGMKRADETLRLLFGDLPREAVPGLREMDFGAFEMRAYAELKNDPLYLDWISGDNEKNLCPGGESGEIFIRRAVGAFCALLEKAGDKLIITHSGVISAVMGHMFPEEGKTRLDWQPGYGEGYTLQLGEKTRYTKLPGPPY